MVKLENDFVSMRKWCDHQHHINNKIEPNSTSYDDTIDSSCNMNKILSINFQISFSMPKYSFTAREIHSLLNGFVCLFKPRDMTITRLQRILIKSICEQANELDMDISEPEIEMPIVGEHPSGALVVVGKTKQIDYSMHPMVVGQMFQPEEILIEPLNPLEPSSSGVCLFGLNKGCDQLEKIRERSWLNEYSLECELGRQTHNHSISGKVNLRAEYDHVHKHQMNTVLSMVRMQFKKAAFNFANIDLESQEAFELAQQGSPRPKVLGSPVIYGIELDQFRSPIFKLRIQVTEENDKFLRELVHEIGCCLGTTASPRRLRRIRQGCFRLEHALLDKHFHLESVLRNLLMCEKMVAKDMDKERSAVIMETEDGSGRGKEEGGGEKTMLEKYGLTDRQLETAELPEEEDCLRLPFGRDYNY